MPSILIENEKKDHHVVHEKVGRGIEFEPLAVITSIQNGGLKLTPEATFWREAPRMVVAKNKFDFLNRLDLRIKHNIYTLIPFCKKKIVHEKVIARRGLELPTPDLRHS